MVDDLKLPAEIGVLIRKRVKAVRACGDDLLDVVIIQRLAVGLSQRLKQEFVARPSGGIARALFFRSQYGEINAGS